MPSTIKTRLFLISDTHSLATGSDTAQTPNKSFNPPFPASDVLIHAGDLTSTGQLDEYRAALHLLSSIPAGLKLVIAGNHDLSLDREYYLTPHDPDGFMPSASLIDTRYEPGKADEAMRIWTGQDARDAGVVYLTEGVHSFDLANGARLTVFASAWQPAFFNWAFNYEHHEDRWNPTHLISRLPNPKPLKKAARDTDSEYARKLAVHQRIIPGSRDTHPIPEGADIHVVITHGPAWKHLDKCVSGDHAGCPQLLQAIERTRPKVHVCGHIHEAWGAERVHWPEKGSQSCTHPRWIEGSENPLGETRTVLGSLVGGENVQTPDDEDVVRRGAAWVDVSATGAAPLKDDEETLVVNACIKDFRYHSHQAGWLVDVDLPLAG